MTNDINSYIGTALSSRQVCSICKQTIPKENKRFSFAYSGLYNSSRFVRICKRCFLELASSITEEDK